MGRRPPPRLIVDFCTEGEPPFELPDDIAAALWTVARRRHRAIGDVLRLAICGGIELRFGVDLEEERSCYAGPSPQS